MSLPLSASTSTLPLYVSASTTTQFPCHIHLRITTASIPSHHHHFRPSPSPCSKKRQGRRYHLTPSRPPRTPEPRTESHPQKTGGGSFNDAVTDEKEYICKKALKRTFKSSSYLSMHYFRGLDFQLRPSERTPTRPHR